MPGGEEAAHHDVEVSEKTQLAQILGDLSITLRGLLEMTNGPDDGEENGGTTEQIHNHEDLIPGVEACVSQLRFVYYYRRDVGEDLQAAE